MAEECVEGPWFVSVLRSFGRMRVIRSCGCAMDDAWSGFISGEGGELSLVHHTQQMRA